jgi:hypothetical protein
MSYNTELSLSAFITPQSGASEVVCLKNSPQLPFILCQLRSFEESLFVLFKECGLLPFKPEYRGKRIDLLLVAIPHRNLFILQLLFNSNFLV